MKLTHGAAERRHDRGLTLQEPSISTVQIRRVLLKPGCANRALSLQDTAPQPHPGLCPRDLGWVTPG